MLGVVEAFQPHWLADVLKYAVAIGGAAGLFAAAGSAMLGVSRVGYSLATNRQIPSAVGRLHGRWGTPYVVIGAAALAAAALVLPTDLELPGRDLRLRRDARVHDRARLGDRPALPRAATATRPYRVPLSIAGPRAPACRSRPCSARCASALGLAGAARVPLRRPLRRAGLAARRARALRHLPQDPAEAAAAAGDDPRAGAAPRGARARVRLDPRPDPRHPARRRHHPDRRPAGRRDARRPRVARGR